MAASLRALTCFAFLVLVIRIVGRRPGKQITPFEFVLVFFMGGLALTAMVGDDASLTNAFVQILTIALAHVAIATARSKAPWLARLLDGTPLILLEAFAESVIHRDYSVPGCAHGRAGPEAAFEESAT